MGRNDQDRLRSYQHRSRSKSRSRSYSRGRDHHNSKHRTGRNDRSRSRSPSNKHSESRSKGYRRDERIRSRSESRSKAPIKGLNTKDSSNDEPADNFPLAITSNDGGEISCSVEETNRIRATLGLLPLEVDDDKEKNDKEGVDDEGFVYVDHTKLREEEEIRFKLENSRRERERLELMNLKGKGLGDLLSEESKGLDVKSWLERSKEKQESALDEMEEEEESKVDEKSRQQRDAKVSLAGLRVAHDITDINEGDTILTLRDTPLLNEKGQIEEADDVLENVDIVHEHDLQETRKIREKSKLPAYSGFDDAEFDSDYDETDRILPQYNERKKKDVFFTLTENGVSEVDRQKSEITAKLRNQSVSVQTVTAMSVRGGGVMGVSRDQRPLASLLSGLSETKTASEYYSKEEVTMMMKKKKRVRRVRKSEKEEEKEDDGMVLEEKDDDERGGRGQVRVTENERRKKKEEEEERQAGYERAREKEEEKNRVFRSGVSVSMTDDVLLSERLMRARQAVIGQRHETIDEIANKVKEQRENDENESVKNEERDSVSEFSSRFKMMMRRKKEEEEEKKEEKKEEREEEKKEEREEEKKEEKKEETKRVLKTDDDDDDDDGDVLQEQSDLGKGLTGVLNMLKSQKNHPRSESAYGRRNDQVILDQNTKDGFVLEYRDKTGRLMSTKEAFRQFSYQFHGKNPGKKNKGKKNLNYVREMATKGIQKK